MARKCNKKGQRNPENRRKHTCQELSDARITGKKIQPSEECHNKASIISLHAKNDNKEATIDGESAKKTERNRTKDIAKAPEQ